jgi:flagellar basal body-associated protein FliL
MKLFQNIEDVLNWLFKLVNSFFVKIFHQTVPDRFVKKIDKQNSKIQKRKHILDKNLSRLSDQFIAKAAAASALVKSQALQRSSNILKRYQTVKSYNYSALTPAKVTAILTAIIAPFFIKVQKWALALKPGTIGVMLVTTSVTSISAIKVYNNSQKIVEEQNRQQEKIVTREIASVAPLRPDHYRVNERQFKVYNLALPVFFDGQKTRRPIKLDITIQTSNKYTKNYLDKNYQEVEDHLNSYILPMLPNFMLESEGKEVFKEKVKIELDKLIHERGMKGHIENVYIDSILSS